MGLLNTVGGTEQRATALLFHLQTGWARVLWRDWAVEALCAEELVPEHRSLYGASMNRSLAVQPVLLRASGANTPHAPHQLLHLAQWHRLRQQTCSNPPGQKRPGQQTKSCVHVCMCVRSHTRAGRGTRDGMKHWRSRRNISAALSPVPAPHIDMALS